MTAVSIAPPAPPAIACEMIPVTLRLSDCAAPNDRRQQQRNDLAEQPASDQTGYNVTNHPEIKSRRCLAGAYSTNCSCNDVDQNLFHVDPPNDQSQKAPMVPLRLGPRNGAVALIHINEGALNLTAHSAARQPRKFR
jgi:hypothetical protein